MKRFHVHVNVDNLAESVRFYSALFASEPTVSKPDYAKWLLEDPRVNFAISQRRLGAGIDHLGIQVEDRKELGDVYDRLKCAARPVLEEGAVVCCYAESEKSWIADPQGISWETFLTTGSSAVYGGDDTAKVAPDAVAPSAPAKSCCAPSCCQPAAA